MIKVCHIPLCTLPPFSSLSSAAPVRGGGSRKWRGCSVLHLLVHVENAQHAAQDGFLRLLGSDPVPDVAQGRAKVGSACREDSPEELCHRAGQSATEEPDNQGPQQDENCWHAA